MFLFWLLRYHAKAFRSLNMLIRIFFNTSSSNSFEILLQNEAVLKACGASDASGFSKTECCTSAVKKWVRPKISLVIYNGRWSLLPSWHGVFNKNKIWTLSCWVIVFICWICNEFYKRRFLKSNGAFFCYCHLRIFFVSYSDTCLCNKHAPTWLILNHVVYLYDTIYDELNTDWSSQWFRCH